MTPYVAEVDKKSMHFLLRVLFVNKNGIYRMGKNLSLPDSVSEWIWSPDYNYTPLSKIPNKNNKLKPRSVLQNAGDIQDGDFGVPENGGINLAPELNQPWGQIIPEPAVAIPPDPFPGDEPQPIQPLQANGIIGGLIQNYPGEFVGGASFNRGARSEIDQWFNKSKPITTSALQGLKIIFKPSFFK